VGGGGCSDAVDFGQRDLGKVIGMGRFGDI